ncbi:fungal-specific transcription factor domain-containing protein [Stemphylium lycopersici]|nr:hypothetical protein TW65_05301 [Stemphylium lycopersici]RAR04521.1 fungal-specific transcription factor domain-containing protein [Stemphylium lycopersici]
MNAETQVSRVVPPSRRRDKPILSCTLCRRRNVPTPKEPKIPNSVHDRINQLEKLVTNLMGSNDASHSSAASLNLAHVHQHHDEDNAEVPSTPDRVKFSGDTTSYSNSGHWTSILDGISELREYLDQMPASASPKDDVLEETPGPELLFGKQRHATKEELIAAVPHRQEADQLIDTFFASMDTHPTILHKPTFLDQYSNFWNNPFQTPTMWLGTLYAALALGSRFQAAVDAHGSGCSDLGLEQSQTLSSARMNFYREKAVQCLLLANYTKCPPSTIETFLLYFGTEFIRSTDAQFSIYMIVGMLVRLCFRMGYHRDPSRFPNISLFKGELRRRKWLVVLSLDLITSSQLGLPRMIQPFMYDTQEPRNLNEDDIYEGMTGSLPPPRPWTEVSQLIYSILLTRLRQAQARIIDLINASSLPPYHELTDLDTCLRHIYDEIPRVPKADTIKDFGITMTPNSMRRFYLDLAFLKAELMLHRPYLKLGRTDQNYEYSRRVCLNAATEMLSFQHKLDAEFQPGGNIASPKWRLSTLSWFLSSLVAQDFLLATTVLVLDLDEDLISPLSKPEDSLHIGVRLDSAPPSREEIVATLRSANRIWIRAIAHAVQDEHDMTSPSSSFDFKGFSPAASGSNGLPVGNDGFDHSFAYGQMPMDLDSLNIPFDWDGILANLQMQPYGEFQRQIFE